MCHACSMDASLSSPAEAQCALTQWLGAHVTFSLSLCHSLVLTHAYHGSGNACACGSPLNNPQQSQDACHQWMEQHMMHKCKSTASSSTPRPSMKPSSSDSVLSQQKSTPPHCSPAAASPAFLLQSNNSCQCCRCHWLILQQQGRAASCPLHCCCCWAFEGAQQHTGQPHQGLLACCCLLKDCWHVFDPFQG